MLINKDTHIENVDELNLVLQERAPHLADEVSLLDDADATFAYVYEDPSYFHWYSQPKG